MVMGMLMIAAPHLLGPTIRWIGQGYSCFRCSSLGAQRLLPILQQAYAGWALMRGGQVSSRYFGFVRSRLTRFCHSKISKPLSFEEKIALNKLSFRYGLQMPWV